MDRSGIAKLSQPELINPQMYTDTAQLFYACCSGPEQVSSEVDKTGLKWYPAKSSYTQFSCPKRCMKVKSLSSSTVKKDGSNQSFLFYYSSADGSRGKGRKIPSSEAMRFSSSDSLWHSCEGIQEPVLLSLICNAVNQRSSSHRTWSSCAMQRKKPVLYICMAESSITLTVSVCLNLRKNQLQLVISFMSLFFFLSLFPSLAALALLCLGQ